MRFEYHLPGKAGAAMSIAARKRRDATRTSWTPSISVPASADRNRRQDGLPTFEDAIPHRFSKTRLGRHLSTRRRVTVFRQTALHLSRQLTLNHRQRSLPLAAKCLEQQTGPDPASRDLDPLRVEAVCNRGHNRDPSRKHPRPRLWDIDLVGELGDRKISQIGSARHALPPGRWADHR